MKRLVKDHEYVKVYKQKLRPHVIFALELSGRKKECEKCLSTENLLLHEDAYSFDNTLANFHWLCKRCHQIHHGCGDRLKQYRYQPQA